jgi:hypothetical protein
MAGAIRQPIDIAALQRYIEQNVPQIKTPLEVKQVGDNSQLQRTCSLQAV